MTPPISAHAFSSVDESEDNLPQRRPSKRLATSETLWRLCSLEKKVDQLLSFLANNNFDQSDAGSVLEQLSSTVEKLSVDTTAIAQLPRYVPPSSSNSEAETTASQSELQEQSLQLAQELSSSTNTVSRPPERLDNHRPASRIEESDSGLSSGVENCQSVASDISGISDIKEKASEHPDSPTIPPFDGINSIVPDLTVLFSLYRNDQKSLELVAFLLRLCLHLSPSSLSAVVSCAYALAQETQSRFKEAEVEQVEEKADVAHGSMEDTESSSSDEDKVVSETKPIGSCECSPDKKVLCDHHRNPLVSLGETRKMSISYQPNGNQIAYDSSVSVTQSEDEVDKSISSIKSRILETVTEIESVLHCELNSKESAVFTKDLVEMLCNSVNSRLVSHQDSLVKLTNMPEEAKTLALLENQQISQICTALLGSIIDYPLTFESLHIVLDQLRSTLFRELIKLHVTCPASDVESIHSSLPGQNDDVNKMEEDFDDSCSVSSFSESLANGLASAEQRLAELEEQRNQLEGQLSILTSLVDNKETEQQKNDPSSESDINSNIIIETSKHLEMQSDHSRDSVSDVSEAEDSRPLNSAQDQWWHHLMNAGDIEEEAVENGESQKTPQQTRNDDDVYELNDTVKRIVPEKAKIDPEDCLTLEDFDNVEGCGEKQKQNSPQADVKNVVREMVSTESYSEVIEQFKDEQNEEVSKMVERITSIESEFSESEDVEVEEKSELAHDVIIESLQKMSPEIQQRLISAFKQHLEQYSN
ncbi:hypothetical protein P9112_002276 [Eukaryota sp. TZLM1-RC]